ncbi:MAG TPA: hypothetical protein VFY34_09645, partial [Pyrinomonadaceae bacterium]|nr:hypothetical protein [Pyrinomonadaceae bacterium]
MAPDPTFAWLAVQAGQQSRATNSEANQNTKGAGMIKRFLSINVLTFALITICLTASTTATATNTGFTTL